MDWRYIKPTSIYNIREFEDAEGFLFPAEFKDCAIMNNGGRPYLDMFDTDVCRGRVVRSLLSFNRGDRDNIWDVHKWNRQELGDVHIAFAIDNFGNLICFEKAACKIVFLDLESGRVEHAADNFHGFLPGLYRQ